MKLFGMVGKKSKPKIKKESKDDKIKNINLFKLEKENKAIEKKNRDIEKFFEKEEDYYSHFWNNNYIEYEINGDRNKSSSINAELIFKNLIHGKFN